MKKYKRSKGVIKKIMYYDKSNRILYNYILSLMFLSIILFKCFSFKMKYSKVDEKEGVLKLERLMFCKILLY